MVRVGLSELAQADVDHVIHPVYSPQEHAKYGPVILASGDGALIKDIDGREYIDGMAALWNVNVGHGRAELGEAARKQMSTLAFNSTYGGYSNEPVIKLGEKLSKLLPKNLNAVYFASGGAEANESAFKIARLYWKLKGYENKTIIVSRRKGYHGLTLGSMSATGIPNYHKYFGPLAPDFQQIGPNYCYRCEWGKVYGSCNIDCADALEEVIRREGADRVAAFIGEPVHGAGGVITPVPEYWPKLRVICDKYNVLMIADEVITGFGRTGKWFCIEHWGVQPDMMTMAKGITSGYIQLAGVAISDEMHEFFNQAPEFTFMHGYTYSGHATACAVSLANLAIFERENLVEQARLRAKLLHRELEQIKGKPMVGEVRGFGLMAGIELVKTQATRESFDPAAKIGRQVTDECMANGVIVRAVGGDIVCMSPPLVITEDQIRKMVRVIGDAIETVARRIL